MVRIINRMLYLGEHEEKYRRCMSQLVNRQGVIWLTRIDNILRAACPSEDWWSRDGVREPRFFFENTDMPRVISYPRLVQWAEAPTYQSTLHVEEYFREGWHRSHVYLPPPPFVREEDRVATDQDGLPDPDPVDPRSGEGLATMLGVYRSMNAAMLSIMEQMGRIQGHDDPSLPEHNFYLLIRAVQEERARLNIPDHLNCNGDNPHELREQVGFFSVGVDHAVDPETQTFMERLVERITATLRETMPNFSNMRLDVDFGIGKAVGGITGMLKSVLEPVGSFLCGPTGELLLTLLSSIGLYFILRKYGNIDHTPACLIVGGVSLLAGTPSLGAKVTDICMEGPRVVLNSVRDLFFPENDLEEQSGSTMRDIATKNILSSILGYLAAGHLIRAKKFDLDVMNAFLATSLDYKRYKEATEVTVGAVFDIAGSFLRYVGEALNIESIKRLGLKFPEIDEISERLRVIVDEMRSGKRALDYHTNEELRVMERRLRTLVHKTIGFDRINQPFREDASALLREVTKLAERSSRAGSTKGGPRMEPIVVAFVGRSRVGKTVAADMFLYETVPLCLSHERLEGYKVSRDNEIFNAHADQGEYWDGYFGQFATKCDDVFQLKDQAGTPNPMFFTLINAVNSNSWILNCAALEDKANKSFTSELLVLTDNTEKLNSQVIKSLCTPEALTGRIHMCMWVSPKPKYCTVDTANLPYKQRRLDPKYFYATRNPEWDGVGPDQFLFGVTQKDPEMIKDFWEFFPYDWAAGERLKESPLSFKRLQAKVVAEYRKKKESSINLIDMYNGLADDAIHDMERAWEHEVTVNAREVKDYNAWAKVKAEEEYLELWRQENEAAELRKRNLREEGYETAEDAAFVEQMLGATRLRWRDRDREDDRDRLEREAWRELEQSLDVPIWEVDIFKVFGYTREESEFKELDSRLRLMRLQMHPDKHGGVKHPMWDHLTLVYEIVKDPVRRKEWLILSSDNAYLEMRKYLLLRELLTEIKYRQDKEDIPIGARVVPFDLSSLDNILKFIPDGYIKNSLPSEPFMQELCRRMDMSMEEVVCYFLTHNYTRGTPMGDFWAKWHDLKECLFQVRLRSVSKLCRTIKDRVFDFLSNKKLLLGLSAVCVTAAGAWVYITNYMEMQSGKPVKKTTRPGKVKSAKTISRNKPTETLDTQGIRADDAFYGIVNKIKKNLVWWSLERDSQKQGWFTFIKKNVAVSVSHFMSKLEEDEIEHIYLHNYEGNWIQKVEVADIEMIYIKESLNDDDGYYHFKTLSREFSDILAHFMNDGTLEEEIIETPHFGVLMKPLIREVEVGGVSVRKCTDCDYLRAMAKPFKDKYGSASWEIGQGFMYNISTQAGDCGLPWIIADERVTRPYIGGFHVAGNTAGYGAGIAVSKASIDAALGEFLPMSEHMLGAVRPEVPEHWEVIKEVPPERQTSSSKLRRTPLYNAWSACHKLPALLHPKTVIQTVDLGDGEVAKVPVLIDPWVNSRLPYGVNNKQLNQRLLERIADGYASKILAEAPQDEPWEPRVLGKYEACSGWPGVFKGIPRNTSAGYPWNKLSKKKFAFFGREGDYTFTTKEWEALDVQVNVDMDNLLAGVLPDYDFLVFLKDELRKESKVKAGLTRSIWGSPINLTIESAMLFKDFMRWLQDHRISNGTAIGVNPYSSEWKVIKEYLQAVGDDMIDGDFSNFDGCIRHQIMEACRRVIEAYYYNATPEEREARRLIVQNLGNPKAIITEGCKSYEVQVPDMLPSGDILTQTMGSLVNNVISRYARADILMREEGYSADEWNDSYHFDFNRLELDRVIVLSDDHIVSVCGEHKRLITQKTYGEAMERMGFKYTDAAKTGNLIDGYKPLSGIQFLKRTWLELPQYPGRVFAPLDMDTILNMPYWYEKGCPPGTIEATVDISLIELSAHGLEEFGYWSSKIGQACREKIGYKSIYAPLEHKPEELLKVWRRAISAYQKQEIMFGL
uniref:RNA-dependent RNA polymerase n=1 Tax=Picornavirales sp. TaxID=1955153 RepID=A0A514DCY4_9VIRU|nr:MAG: RNA-dependent RNA polymerase [Picornavirales sp.]